MAREGVLSGQRGCAKWPDRVFQMAREGVISGLRRCVKWPERVC